MTNYLLCKIGRMLKSGQAWIKGRISGGHRWPDHPHYWIIIDGGNQMTYHVLTDERPTWGKYCTYNP